MIFDTFLGALGHFPGSNDTFRLFSCILDDFQTFQGVSDSLPGVLGHL